MKLLEKGSVQLLVTWAIVILGSFIVGNDTWLNVWLKGMGCLFVAYALWGNYPGLSSWHQDILNKWGEKKGKWMAWGLWFFLLPGVLFTAWILIPFAFVFSLPLLKGMSQLWMYTLSQKVGYAICMLVPFVFALWRMPTIQKRMGYRWWMWFFHFSWTFILSGISFFALSKL